MTLSELNSLIISDLTPALGQGEAKATARMLLEDDLHVTPTTLFTRGDRVLEPETVTRYRRFISRIAAGEPPQYLLGSAHFMGMELKVTPATLIPRPETAELVDIITDRCKNRPDLRVLDIGTGSGCIALALSRALPFADVEGIDISAEAIAVASENARKLGAKVDFHVQDIFSAPAATYDIIVSNPPYIAESERPSMERRVKDFEPDSALFVPDSAPLRFYTAITAYAKSNLDAGGLLAFEINPRFAEELKSMMESCGFNCEIIRDSFGKNRFALGTHAS